MPNVYYRPVFISLVYHLSEQAAAGGLSWSRVLISDINKTRECLGSAAPDCTIVS